LLAAAICVLSAAAAALPAYLPTHDGPQHVFGIHAANHLEEPGTGWSHWLRPNLPPTNHGFGVLFAPLDAWLPWDTALRVALGLMALLWVAAGFAAARAAHPARGWLGLLLAAAAFQWSVYMGFFSFYVATATGLCVLALALRTPRWSPRQRVLLAGLLCLEALMHVVPAVLTGGLLALLALARAPGRQWLRELGAVAAMGAPAALVALRLAWVGLDTLGDHNQGPGVPAETPPTPWWTLGKCFLGGPAWRAWPLSLLALASPALALLAARRAAGAGGSLAGALRLLRAEDRALLIGGGLLLVASLALPLHIRAWDYFSVRFLPLAVCCLLLALPVERLSPAARGACAAAAAGFAFAASGWALAYNLDLARRAQPALAGLSADVRSDGLRLPIVLDPLLGRPFDDSEAPMPYVVPLFNLAELYATEQGGVSPYGFTGNPHLHPVLLRNEPGARLPESPDRGAAADLATPANRDNAALRQAIAVHWASYGPRYRDIILWGRPEDAELLLDLGYEPVWRREGLLLARFVGCPLDIRIEPAAALAADSVLELGWFPAGMPTHRFTLARARREGDALQLPVRQSCAGVWLRFADRELACQGADADGRLLVASTRERAAVACRVTRRESLAARP
jgi:hypothetical protein